MIEVYAAIANKDLTTKFSHMSEGVDRKKKKKKTKKSSKPKQPRQELQEEESSSSDHGGEVIVPVGAQWKKFKVERFFFSFGTPWDRFVLTRE
jgi:hypothetical protein